jgi:hypothetical protein
VPRACCDPCRKDHSCRPDKRDGNGGGGIHKLRSEFLRRWKIEYQSNAYPIAGRWLVSH